MNARQEIHLNSIVKANSGVLSTELSSNEQVMMDMDQGMYFGLEDVAKAIWELMAEPTSVEDICRFVHARYDTTFEVIQASTLEFLEELSAADLLEHLGVEDRAP
ncbi:MAG: PqqD family protein [Actinomycetia bacterium]|nr:PqqD family protein [Actinomycetes bacterium]MCP3998627.1 PqqD family protein [bacterium]MCP4083906.1 PqqD family protein [Actinomycetes bacterium]